MRSSHVLLLLAGIAAPHACGGTAIVDPEDDDGGGGSGATTSSSSNTSSSSSMGGAPSTTSVGPAPGPGPSTSSGMTMCVGCGDYVSGAADDIDDICGFISLDLDGTLNCLPDTSCELLADLQACTCSDCGNDCVATCNGGEISQECLGCITNDCNAEFNSCTGDVP